MTLLFYDGVCGLCNSWVNRVIEKDRKDQFRFATLQSDLAKKVLSKHNCNYEDLNTLYLVTDYEGENEKIHTKSTAALKVFTILGGKLGFLSRILLIVPAFIRNVGYSLLAKTRYRIFGKYNTCKLPNPDLKYKFLDI